MLGDSVHSVTIDGDNLDGVEFDFRVNSSFRNFRIEFEITFLVVVGEGSIRQINDELLVELADGQIGSARTVDNLEAVVEQGLALVVDHAQQFNRSPGTA